MRIFTDSQIRANGITEETLSQAITGSGLLAPSCTDEDTWHDCAGTDFHIEVFDQGRDPDGKEHRNFLHVSAYSTYTTADGFISTDTNQCLGAAVVEIECGDTENTAARNRNRRVTA